MEDQHFAIHKFENAYLHPPPEVPIAIFGSIEEFEE